MAKHDLDRDPRLGRPLMKYLTWQTFGGLHSLPLIEKMKIIHAGVNKEEWDLFRSMIALTTGQLAELVGLTDRTVFLKGKVNEVFSRIHSDRILFIMDTCSMVRASIPAINSYREWMNQKNDELEFETPLEALAHYAGQLAIRSLLRRSMYGNHNYLI